MSSSARLDVGEPIEEAMGTLKPVFHQIRLIHCAYESFK